MLQTLKKRLKAGLWPRLVRRMPTGCHLSYSQFGEDRILSWLFQHRRGQPGFYVDIGAYHPTMLSNTYALYCEGWRGVNVEPRPEALREFEIFRPRVTNLSLCITPTPADEVVFYIFAEAVYNTIDPAEAEHNIAQGRALVRKGCVRGLTLSALLDAYRPPGSSLELLTIDAEGVDEAILLSNDWSHHTPMVIVFEARGRSYADVLDLPVVRHLDRAGYEVAAKSGESIFLRHRVLWGESYERCRPRVTP